MKFFKKLVTQGELDHIMTELTIDQLTDAIPIMTPGEMCEMAQSKLCEKSYNFFENLCVLSKCTCLTEQK